MRTMQCNAARGGAAGRVASSQGRCSPPSTRTHPGSRPALCAQSRLATSGGEDGDSTPPRSELTDELAEELLLTASSAEGTPTVTAPPPEKSLLPLHEKKAGDILGGKYEVLEVLGRGSNGVTYRTKAPDGATVAVKELSLKRMTDWKQLDMFEREAKTLRALKHPGIPAYVDYFEDNSQTDDSCYYLVQQIVEGKSLGTRIKEGWRPEEAEIRRIALELLRILTYLGNLRPAVIHRDVKPDNIILTDPSGGPPGSDGGTVHLVDFGGVQGAVLGGDGQSLGSTVVGTYGFMAPEQFSGAAQPGSDVYAAGGVLLQLLSGLPPSAFPQRRLRIDFSGSVTMSPRLEQLLEGMLEPVLEDRITAEDATRLLELPPGATLEPPASTALTRGEEGGGQLMVPRLPVGSRVKVTVNGSRLEVDIPPAGLRADTVATGSFAVAWNAFVGVWTAGAIASGGVLMGLFSLPFWFAGVQMARSAFGGALRRERLEVGRSRFNLSWQLAVLKRGAADWDPENAQGVEGRTADLGPAAMVTKGYMDDTPVTAIELPEGAVVHTLGEGLQPREQQYVVGRINQHLKDTLKMPLDPEALKAALAPERRRMGGDRFLSDRRFNRDSWDDDRW